MKTFTQDAFQRARTFIITRGRELDQRLFAYHFESGSRPALLGALAQFQNDDGGFGHLHHFAQLVPKVFLSEVSESAVPQAQPSWA